MIENIDQPVNELNEDLVSNLQIEVNTNKASSILNNLLARSFKRQYINNFIRSGFIQANPIESSDAYTNIEYRKAKESLLQLLSSGMFKSVLEKPRQKL